MKTEFGEFQFGYSCTRELENGGKWLPALGMPYIPTQNEEGGGFPVDVAIGAFFLQYKVPDYLIRSNAREWTRLLPEGPYFRFGIYPRSPKSQHDELRKFARNKINVYYCAPGFNTVAEYVRYHRQRRIAERTAFIPVDELPPNRGLRAHYVVYRTRPLQFKWCSEGPVPVRGILGIQALTDELRRDEAAFGTLANLLPRLEAVLESLTAPREPLVEWVGVDNEEREGPESHPDIRRLTDLASVALAQHGLVLTILSLSGELPLRLSNSPR